MSRTPPRAHASQNHRFFANANRRGEVTVEGQVLAGDLGKSVICGRFGTLLAAARPEPTLVRSDCVPWDDGETHPMGTRDLKDLRSNAVISRIPSRLSLNS